LVVVLENNTTSQTKNVPSLRRKDMSKVSMEVMLMEEWARVDRMVKLMVRR
jgi:hypothetical protein